MSIVELTNEYLKNGTDSGRKGRAGKEERTMESRELEKIQNNPEDVALIFETMGKSLAWSIRKGLEHGEDFENIVRKFIARNI